MVAPAFLQLRQRVSHRIKELHLQRPTDIFGVGQRNELPEGSGMQGGAGVNTPAGTGAAAHMMASRARTTTAASQGFHQASIPIIIPPEHATSIASISPPVTDHARQPSPSLGPQTNTALVNGNNSPSRAADVENITRRLRKRWHAASSNDPASRLPNPPTLPQQSHFSFPQFGSRQSAQELHWNTHNPINNPLNSFNPATPASYHMPPASVGGPPPYMYPTYPHYTYQQQSALHHSRYPQARPVLTTAGSR
ncbi:hypothetical protein BOTBODRAFT_48827 [Botryobasidium botryosum FD-172 SS1]|uniref:Uncharacterized protein n=1 Tax=Botryobasidium botryosum (strain FD-172 SS1) TaxID=930990 RepID=A0A067LYG5_BOTB1|nr:hypothetical protein BOTBODRAFT_48827 [Botryobasidium botryosum FD-172 SS1]